LIEGAILKGLKYLGGKFFNFKLMFNMVEFKIQLEESLVQIMGYQQIETYLQEWTQKVVLKIAAQDILEDLERIDLENDVEWQLSRSLAWQQEKHKYFS
jgi:hypothetical protein